jgi:hypothetical protein
MLVFSRAPQNASEGTNTVVEPWFRVWLESYLETNLRDIEAVHHGVRSRITFLMSPPHLEQ